HRAPPLRVVLSGYAVRGSPVTSGGRNRMRVPTSPSASKSNRSSKSFASASRAVKQGRENRFSINARNEVWEFTTWGRGPLDLRVLAGKQAPQLRRRALGRGRLEQPLGDERARAGAETWAGPRARADVPEALDRRGVARAARERTPKE